jgi:hypothetical protein
MDAAFEFLRKSVADFETIGARFPALDSTTQKIIDQFQQAIALLEAAKGVDRERAINAFNVIAEYYGVDEGDIFTEVCEQIRRLLEALERT